MPPEQENNGSTPETGDQEQQGQQQQTTEGETPTGESQQQTTIDDSTQLPDTHPLVKSLGAYKDTIAKLKTDLAEARTNSAKATQLEQDLAARPTTEAMETLQTRYDRLESFLLAAGGPIARALDSRTFSRDLFETDKDIADLVKDWHKNNPSATSTALGGASQQQGGTKINPNDLIRAAMRGGNSSGALG